MIRRPLTAFATTIGFCLVLLVSACSNADAPDGPAMWKLETEQTTIYFLGSFHLLDPDLDWRDDRIEHALNEADAVFFEIDDREANEEAMQQEMIRMSMLPPGESLKAMLDPQVYADLEKTASRYGLDVGTMDGMKPWFVAISLSVMEMLIQGHSPDAGVDKTLFDDAEARGIPIRAFETVQEQLEIIDSLSRTDPNVLIVDTLRYLDEDSTLLEDMVQAWLEGDTDTIAALTLGDFEKYGEAYNVFLTDRNRAWVKELDARIRQGGTYFVVVGAGHLVGPDSVIQMLLDKGHAVARY